jgi:CRISPR-associated protein Csb2
MIALRLRFPAGRYHATPWGRHVNEAAIAWPPEPVRILRALIACHHRKADKAQFSDEALADLIDALAGELPIYRLPPAVRAHTRHYMPAPVEKTLVFDAFARFDADEPLFVGWPGISLSDQQRAHLDHLAVRLGYLGRAESWLEAELLEWNGEDANAKPHDHDGEGKGRASDPESCLVSLYAPLSPKAYRVRREQLIHDERERRRAGWTKKARPTDKALEKDMRDFLATLPERLALALAIDTSALHQALWSDPPACRRVLYAAPELESVWRGPRRRTTRTRQDDPTVARFVIAGRPRPRIEDAVKIGELVRLAALAQFGWTRDETTGRLQAKAPPVISGRGPGNHPLKDACHNHAFWLPEDADEDGEIDHIVVYARGGFNREVRTKLDQITKLWIERPGIPREEEDVKAHGSRQEWRLALERFGMPKNFRNVSRILGNSRTWESKTPFLAAGHLKSRGYPAEASRLLARRGFPEPTKITFLRPPSPAVSEDGDPYAKDIGVMIRGRLRRAIHFHRFRSRGGERQPDTIGTFLRLEFAEPVEGPLALGYACHFGLGLFVAAEEQ